MINDINNNIEFDKASTERLRLIQNLIKDYIKDFDVIRFTIKCDRRKDREAKLTGAVEYNVIRP